MTETLIKTYYLIYHMILQMWESEPIKFVLGVEILIFWILLIGWGFASWRLKNQRKKIRKNLTTFSMINLHNRLNSNQKIDRGYESNTQFGFKFE